MNFLPENEKLNTWSVRVLLGVMTLEFAGCFLSQGINGTAARFTSLLSFFALAFLCLAGSDLKDRGLSVLKDPEVLIVGACSIAALLNLFLIGSNKGAFLTAADVLMMLYAAGRLKLSRRQYLYFGGLGSAFLICWYGTVKWDYNFNMAGLVFMVLCILGLILLQLLIDDGNLWYGGYVQILLYCCGLLFCILYHARCAMAGVILFAVLYLLSGWIIRHPVLQWILTLAATLGSLGFTLFYMLLGSLGVSLKILYKDVLSGRQDIWAELWQAFLHQPITGIGSSYELKSFFIFEVHNGLLDILVVHGIFVFLGVLILLVRRLLSFQRGLDASLRLDRIRMAGVFAILFTSFFENFFIVSPYLLILLVLLAGCGRDRNLI